MPDLAQSGDVFTCTIKRNPNTQEDEGKIGFVMIKPKAFIFVQLKFPLEVAWRVVCAAFPLIRLTRRSTHKRWSKHVLGCRALELLWALLFPSVEAGV